jgi:hypothetical protein
LDILCAPIRPGIVVNFETEEASFEAPWWVPATFDAVKAPIFSAACGSRKQTKVTWKPIKSKSKGRGELIFSNLVDNEGDTEEVIEWRRNVAD